MSPQGRDPFIVIGQVLDLVPSEHTALRAALEAARERGLYLAPEQHLGLWRYATALIVHHLPCPPQEPWQWAVLSVWADATAAVCAARADGTVCWIVEPGSGGCRVGARIGTNVFWLAEPAGHRGFYFQSYGNDMWFPTAEAAEAAALEASEEV